MAKVVFRTHEGVSQLVEAKVGASLMSSAKAAGVPGILAECGGSMVCGTCHVWVDEPWFGDLPPASDMETALIDFGLYAKANSRLACQILVTDAMDGMQVGIPPSQR